METISGEQKTVAERYGEIEWLDPRTGEIAKLMIDGEPTQEQVSQLRIAQELMRAEVELEPEPVVEEEPVTETVESAMVEVRKKATVQRRSLLGMTAISLFLSLSGMALKARAGQIDWSKVKKAAAGAAVDYIKRLPEEKQREVQREGQRDRNEESRIRDQLNDKLQIEITKSEEQYRLLDKTYEDKLAKIERAEHETEIKRERLEIISHGSISQEEEDKLRLDRLNSKEWRYDARANYEKDKREIRAKIDKLRNGTSLDLVELQKEIDQSRHDREAREQKWREIGEVRDSLPLPR